MQYATLSIPKETRNALKATAQKRGMKLSAMAAFVLENWLTSQRKRKAEDKIEA